MEKSTQAIGKAQMRARKSLLARYRKSVGTSRNGAKHSWWKVGKELGGFNAGYLKNVSDGKRRASLKLLKALNIKPDAVVIVAAPCKRCGQVHISKRCTHRKTYDDNCREYDDWLNDPKTQRQLAAMLEWAETPPTAR